MKPVAEIYLELISASGVLALFAAEDVSMDAGWIAGFGNAIKAVGEIVPSRTIRKENTDITRGIKSNSKKSVLYGKTLMYWIKKVFADKAGLMESFPVAEANRKMHLGDTEGMLYAVQTIIKQIVANQGALVAGGWKVQNLTNYQNLLDGVFELNTQQELAKKAIPENTDAARKIRNECYGFIQTLLELKEVVYYEDLQKRHDWAVKTILKRMRSGGGKKEE